MAIATKSKPKVPQKKRTAQHHRQSKHYLKAYWPYIPMVMVVGLGLIVNSIWSSHSVLGASSDFSSQTLLTNTNTERINDRETTLSIDPVLAKAAQAKANDMVARNYWSHNTPDGKTPWTFITGAGYDYQLAGENLAYGFTSAPSTITGWMNSPEHRANILNNGYSQVGFGVASSQNYQSKGPQIIVVALYATPVAAASNITFTVASPTSTVLGSEDANAKVQPPSQKVSRIQLLTNGQAPWSIVAVSAIAGASLTVFLIRHGLYLRRLLTRGEMFITHHPLIDLIIVILGTAGFILSRTSGFIR